MPHALVTRSSHRRPHLFLEAMTGAERILLNSSCRYTSLVCPSGSIRWLGSGCLHCGPDDHLNQPIYE